MSRWVDITVPADRRVDAIAELVARFAPVTLQAEFPDPLAEPVGEAHMSVQNVARDEVRACLLTAGVPVRAITTRLDAEMTTDVLAATSDSPVPAPAFPRAAADPTIPLTVPLTAHATAHEAPHDH